jgi:SPP1 gp7 family putative phage head morphogenesis protein
VLVRGLAPDGTLESSPKLVSALRSYADTIEDWAYSVAGYMLADAARRDLAMWTKHSKEMGQELRKEIRQAPTGQILQQLQAKQVELIKSIPLDAAERVHRLSMEATISSARANVVARAILETESVSEAKARLIARTEVSRVASNLVQARSQYAGSDGYIWRTSGDMDVRDSHAKMEGVYVRWGAPPTLDGMTGHAGTLPNCRCFAEPIFPDADL